MKCFDSVKIHPSFISEPFAYGVFYMRRMKDQIVAVLI
jgi:hypothetical protein